MLLCHSVSYDFRILTLIFHLLSAKSWYARCSCNDNRGTYLHTVFEYKAASYVHSIHTNVDTNVDMNVDTTNYSYQGTTYVASEVLAGKGETMGLGDKHRLAPPGSE